MKVTAAAMGIIMARYFAFEQHGMFKAHLKSCCLIAQTSAG